jgi:hypothetical protein
MSESVIGRTLTACDATVDAGEMGLNPASEQAFGRPRDALML